MGGTMIKEPASGSVELSLSDDVQYVVGPVSSVTELDNEVVADSVSGYSKIGRRQWLVLWICRTRFGETYVLRFHTDDLENLED